MTTVPILLTERLRLRPLRAGDKARFIRVVEQGAVQRYLDGIPTPDQFENLLGETDKWRWIITRRDDPDGRLLGSVNIFKDSAIPELGYWLDEAEAGQGVMSEAVRAVLAEAFAGLGLERVQALVASSNPASEALLYKLGLRRLDPRQVFVNPAPEPGWSYLIDRTGWQAENGWTAARCRLPRGR